MMFMSNIGVPLHPERFGSVSFQSNCVFLTLIDIPTIELCIKFCTANDSRYFAELIDHLICVVCNPWSIASCDHIRAIRVFKEYFAGYLNLEHDEFRHRQLHYTSEAPSWVNFSTIRLGARHRNATINLNSVEEISCNGHAVTLKTKRYPVDYPYEFKRATAAARFSVYARRIMNLHKASTPPTREQFNALLDDEKALGNYLRPRNALVQDVIELLRCHRRAGKISGRFFSIHRVGV